MIRDSNVQIFDSSISDNSNGGIYNRNYEDATTYCTLTNVTISGNTSGYTGGQSRGLEIENDIVLTLIDVTISDNISTHDSWGGGLGFTNCNHDVITSGNVVISNNSTTSHGGGISIYNSYLSISDVIINNNFASTGGGIYVYDCDPNISDIMIDANTSTSGGGGGMRISYSNPNLSDIIIQDNSAAHNGGGIEMSYSSPTINNIDIINNNSGLSGGGVWAILCNSDISEVTISGNDADNNCGGIYLSNSNPSIANSVISNNTSSNDCGGVYIGYNSHPSLTYCTISENVSERNGGGLYFSQQQEIIPTVSFCIISGNTALQFGGGICCKTGGSPIISNTTINGNISNLGGGIFSQESNPILSNVTISGNKATNTQILSGGGIFAYWESDINVENSVVWSNYPNTVSVSGYGSDSGSFTASYSDIEGGLANISIYGDGIVNWLEGNIDDDPLFVVPVDPTTAPTIAGDLHLTEISPCIDTGDSTTSYDPDGTITDMGAYYFHQGTLQIPENIQISKDQNVLLITWNSVPGATSYKVFSSDNPYSDFTEDTSGIFNGESWYAQETELKRFYYVKAVQ